MASWREDGIRRALARAYRTAFARIDEPAKRRAMQQYVALLTSAEARRAERFELSFLRIPDLVWLGSADQALIVSHLMDRIRATPELVTLPVTKGLAAHLHGKAVGPYVTALMAMLVRDDSPKSAVAARRLLFGFDGFGPHNFAAAARAVANGARRNRRELKKEEFQLLRLLAATLRKRDETDLHLEQ